MCKKIDVSVVMPVYKVEKYIEKSVESICRQHFSGNLELILVDDGTPDESISVAEMTIRKYPQVNCKIVRKKNGGLPSARNFGMKYAEGKYICFIDSDDIISENHIQYLYDLNQKYNLIASYADFELTSEKNREGVEVENDGYELIERKSLLNGFLNRYLKIHCCAILYNYSYLKENDLIFNEKLRYGEDIEFMWRVFPKIDKIGHAKVKSYKYLQRPNSIMTSQSIDKIIVLCDEFKKVVSENMNTYPDDMPIFSMLMGKAQLAFIRTSAETSEYKTFKKVLSSIEYKDNIRKLKDITNFPVKLLGVILLISPKVFYLVVNINRKVKKI